MVAQFCSSLLQEYQTLVTFFRTFMSILCALILTFSLVATLGNLLSLHALRKASSIPATLKKLFLSLAFSDLALGMFPQLMLGVIVAVMLKMAASGNYDFNIFCPAILITSYFSFFHLACASFLNVTAIAADRLLVISLHLRYQELVTSRRMFIALASVWVTSAIAASIFISLPTRNIWVSNVVEMIGLLVTTVAYLRLYKVVRYHQNQIYSQCQLQYDQAMEVLREKKSSINALFVYAVFLACYVTHFCCSILLIVGNVSMSLLAVHQASLFLVLLNSSLNPLVYFWRYREIRETMKRTVNKILRIT